MGRENEGQRETDDREVKGRGRQTEGERKEKVGRGGGGGRDFLHIYNVSQVPLSQFQEAKIDSNVI